MRFQSTFGMNKVKIFSGFYRMGFIGCDFVISVVNYIKTIL
jgi:hypothetical protein